MMLSASKKTPWRILAITNYFARSLTTATVSQPSDPLKSKIVREPRVFKKVVGPKKQQLTEEDKPIDPKKARLKRMKEQRERIDKEMSKSD